MVNGPGHHYHPCLTNFVEFIKIAGIPGFNIWEHFSLLREEAYRRWYKMEGEAGLKDISRRPLRSPNRTSKQVEVKVIEIRKNTGYGKRRICWYLFREEGIKISESTVRNILRRNNLSRKVRRRKVFYPAFWVYDQKSPFCLAQVDTKEIYDKGTLGKEIYTHLWRAKFPRYQWTFCEGKTR